MKMDADEKELLDSVEGHDQAGDGVHHHFRVHGDGADPTGEV